MSNIPEVLFTIWKMEPDGEYGHGDSDTLEIAINEPLKEQLIAEIIGTTFGVEEEDIKFTATEEYLQSWFKLVAQGYEVLEEKDYTSISIATAPTEWGYMEFELTAEEPEDY